MQELGEWEFGYWDMGLALDLLENAFVQIAENGEWLLDEDFMMNIISTAPILNTEKVLK